MHDRQKVIKGLELCDIGSGKIWCYESDCPYYQNGCTERLKEDALELLKEAQESPVIREEIVNDVVKNLGVAKCPECDKVWVMCQPEQMRYCPRCGKMVNFRYIV